MRRYNYIYKITNLTNGKIYIGKHSTDNLDDGYFGSGKLIKQSIQKRGIENFKKEYLVFTDNEERLNWFERYYIKKYKTYNSSNGYNLTKGGDGTLGMTSPNKGKFGRLKGIKRSEETKKRISESLKGKTKGRIPWNKGISHSDETKKKISESKKGQTHPKRQPMSEETKKKISDTKKGCVAWNKGLNMKEYNTNKIKQKNYN